MAQRQIKTENGFYMWFGVFVVVISLCACAWHWWLSMWVCCYSSSRLMSRIQTIRIFMLSVLMPYAFEITPSFMLSVFVARHTTEENRVKNTEFIKSSKKKYFFSKITKSLRNKKSNLVNCFVVALFFVFTVLCFCYKTRWFVELIYI